ncbi:MAG TPA: hypothetical protein VIY56_16460 [Vicinamibacterales bacterium]
MCGISSCRQLTMLDLVCRGTPHAKAAMPITVLLHQLMTDRPT